MSDLEGLDLYGNDNEDNNDLVRSLFRGFLELEEAEKHELELREELSLLEAKLQALSTNF